MLHLLVSELLTFGEIGEEMELWLESISLPDTQAYSGTNQKVIKISTK